MARYNFNDICEDHKSTVAQKLQDLYNKIDIQYTFDQSQIKLIRTYDDDFGDTVFEIKIHSVEPPNNKVELRVVEFYEGVFGTIQAFVILPKTEKIELIEFAEEANDEILEDL